jgi:ParB family transcriptional regulator, chromosome partitioning protein
VGGSPPTGFISTIKSKEIVMSYIQCTSEQPQLIAVSRLEKSPLNARRTHAKLGMDELKASLLAHGLMQNLVVTDSGDGNYRVIAGGRRLEAIHSLQAEGKLPQDFAVPCQIVTEEHALEMSLAENTVRMAMHPADQYEAFAALIEQGESAADVAHRFGIDESLVLKRMKLARVAPQLLEEYRNEGMTLECLIAYTITDDHRRQMKVFKSLQDWQKEDPSAIRVALTEKMIESGDKLARFVGLEAYEAAGGSTRADLFGDEVYLEKPALLHKLAEEKLDGIRKELEAEGWGWAEINPERDYDSVHRCGRIKPQLIGVPAELVDLKSQLDAELEVIEESIREEESDSLLEQQQAVSDRLEHVEQQLAGYVGFDATQKALAGCFVSIGHDGSVFLDKGLVKPEHRKLLAKLLGSDGSDVKPGKAKPKHAMPESLRRDLAADRLETAQVEIARHPAIALDLLVYQVASNLLGEYSLSDGPNVEFRLPKPGKEREPSVANRDLAAIEKALPTAWLKAKTEEARFEAFCSLPQQSKLQLLAYCVAQTLQPKFGPATSDEPTAYDAALAQTAGQVARYWRPTKTNFLGRITRDQLLAVGCEVLGEPWAQSHGNDKKALLVEQLDRAFSHPDKSGRTPGQIEKLKSWLPIGMSFDLNAAPIPAKAKKARKAA